MKMKDFKLANGAILRAAAWSKEAVVPMRAKIVPLDGDKTPEQKALIDAMYASYPVLTNLNQVVRS